MSKWMMPNGFRPRKHHVSELKAATQYMSQSFRIKDQKIRDLFLDTASEPRAKVVYEYLYRQIGKSYGRESHRKELRFH